MKLVLTIKMDNDAYLADPDDPESKARSSEEVIRQLHELVKKIDNRLLFAGDEFHVSDINGNYTLSAMVED